MNDLRNVTLYGMRLPRWLPEGAARGLSQRIADACGSGTSIPPWWSWIFVRSIRTCPIESESFRSHVDAALGTGPRLRHHKFVIASVRDGSSVALTKADAASLLGLASAMLPARIVNEELGDALEDIEARIAAGRPRSEIRLKLYASVFWAVWHTVLYAVKGVTDALGRKGG